MNLVIAFVLLAVAYSAIGYPAASTTVDSLSQCVPTATDQACTATDTQPGPGVAAGMQPGDRIVAFNGTSISSWDQLTTLIRAAGGQTVTIVVDRGGQQVPLQVTLAQTQRPVLDANGQPVTGSDGKEQTTQAGFLGVTPTEPTHRASLASIPGIIGDRTWATVKVVATLPTQAYAVLHETITGQPRGASSVVGLVGVGRFAGDIATAPVGLGVKFAGLLELLAALNLSLFVFNLIPLPPLDGGHVAAALWEGLKRQTARLRNLPKPRVADTARLVPLAYTVFAVLGALGVMLIWADIVNPVRIG